MRVDDEHDRRWLGGSRSGALTAARLDADGSRGCWDIRLHESYVYVSRQLLSVVSAVAAQAHRIFRHLLKYIYKSALWVKG